MTHSLHIKTLGGLSIQRDGEVVDDFASRKAELLLLYLACNPRIHQREALADLLWDDRPQRRAMANLRVVLSSLRKVAGPFVTITRDTAAVDTGADVWLDAAELEKALAREMTAESAGRAAEALDLYRGDFLQGVHVHGAHGLQEWMVHERERLHRLAVDGGQRLVDHYLETARYSEGKARAMRLLEIDPLLERGYRQLMELLARDGQRAAALAQYETCRQLLEKELGVDPAAETVALYDAIRDDALPERPPSSAMISATLPDITTLPSFLIEAEADESEAGVFVTREPELAWLGRHLDAALAGNGRLLFVNGEAGIGKTSLLREFARRASDAHTQLLVAGGRCSALGDAGDPYLPFRQLLGQLTGDVEGELAAGRLTAAQATRLWQGLTAALATLLQHGPGLINRFLSGAALVARVEEAAGGGRWLGSLRVRAEQDAAPLTESGDLQQPVTAVLQAMARQRPLLLLLDDAQWADRASLGLLFHLCHHLAGHRILIAAAYRPEEVDANSTARSLSKVVNESRRRFGDVELELAPAVRRQGRVFVDELLDSEPNRLEKPFRQELLQRTGGHPLFTVELLRAMQGRGDLAQDVEGFWIESQSLDWTELPAQVEGVIAARVERVPPDLRRLLEIASVVGETFTPAVVARVVEEDERGVLRRFSGELDRRYRLVRADGRQEQNGRWLVRYRFRHALFHQYLYERLDDVERAYLHEDVGLALENLYGSDTAAIAPQLAHHFRQADVAEKAISYAQQAGDAARTLYAHDEAVNHYRHALTLLKATGRFDQTARTLMKLALTHHQAFQYRRAQRAYEEAFRLWQPRSTPANHLLPPAPHPLRMSISEPFTLDPSFTYHVNSGRVTIRLFCGLVQADQTEIMPNLAGTIAPDAAARWEIQDGGKTYVFHLRSDVRWSDGMPLTAHDFAFAWKRALAPETRAPLAELLCDIKGAQAYNRGEHVDASQIGIHAPDEHTFVVELEQPVAYFLSIVTHAVARAVPAHVVSAVGEEWTDKANIATSGPFQLESWEPGQGMALARSRHYHRPFRGNVEGVLLYFDSRGQGAQLYESGERDVLLMRPNQFPDHAARAQFIQRHATDLVSIPVASVEGITFNLRQPPFSDVQVRRAFALATDQGRYVRIVADHTPLPATGGFVPPGMPGHTPGIALPFDPAQARQLLAQAGFPGGKGFPTVTLRWAKQDASGRHPRWLAEQWRIHLGVSVEWQLRPDDGSVREKTPPLRRVSWRADYPDPDNFLRVFWREVQTSWQNEDYWHLMDQARALTDQSRRLVLYRQADRILTRNALVLPLSYGRDLWLLKRWVKPNPTPPSSQSFWQDVIVEPH